MSYRPPVQLSLFDLADFEPPPPSPRDARAELQAEYDRRRRAHGLPPAEVVLSQRRLTGGLIRYGKRGQPHRITVSAHMSAEDQHETLLHEIAHAICYAADGDAREGHGPRFWAVAKSLGVRSKAAPETSALRAYRERRAVHRYRCESCGNVWKRVRPFRRSMLCRSCDDAGRPAHLKKQR